MTIDGIGAAYDAASDGWRAGPERMYARMAEVLADHAPVDPLDMAGARVLDAGAGTGVAGEALRRRGASTVVAVDLAPGMLPRAPALSTVGDLARLPFADGAFDLAAAAFSLNHFEDPVPAMAELRRVATALVASAYAPDWSHPAKEAIEGVLVRHGYQPPEWYAVVRADANPSPSELEEFARRAGYAEARAVTLDVATGMDTAADLVDWRFGMAHTAPYVDTLAPDDRARLRADAEAAVAGLPPLVVAMIVLSAR
ncbi:class I SAM-dependent methyltransferase [Nocardioides humilatus]|uniref:Class I SAM-dependent methyltransferase n=1 Tax=Nocardioides humilatus TaxID=2607660 RepID=A0A5B1LL24_9ACTN|nr:class I SAM-dependent methyltransferase [Nocardioides humilatus]KAA1421273.1 class I SAM-dependent methyltransferase [Nocardioides humilatus]